MKKLEISITKAQLVSFGVNLDEEGLPVVGATVSLLTEGGKQMTTYTISTGAWTNKDKFDLPASAIQPIVDLSRILESVVVKHCRDSQKALPAKMPEPELEEVIDVSNIPF